MSPGDSVERVIAIPRERFGTVVRDFLEPVEERPTMGDSLRTTGRVCSLLVGLAVVTWASGRPYLFPSLGPSAYALAVNPSAATSRPQRVFGGHLFGVAGGFVAYHLLAPGLTVTHVSAALTVEGARIGGSAVLSIGLTSVAMLATDLRHSPACATTLIVALGFLTTLAEAGVILTAVLVLVTLDHVVPTFGGVEDPPQ